MIKLKVKVTCYVKKLMWEINIKTLIDFIWIIKTVFWLNEETLWLNEET